MRPPPPPRAIVPALAAVAGVVVAHVVDYLVVFPNGGQRADALATTGHAYWPVAVAAALAAGAVALMLSAARGVRRGGASRSGVRASGGAGLLTFGWLLGWQVVAFVAMETGERAAAGLPPSVLLHSATFWLGLVLQVPVAWLARRLLHAVEGAACRLATRLNRRPARRPQSTPFPGRVVPLRTLVFLGGPGPRGPPQLRDCA
jgi:hypothetical protein